MANRLFPLFREKEKVIMVLRKRKNRKNKIKEIENLCLQVLLLISSPSNLCDKKINPYALTIFNDDDDGLVLPAYVRENILRERERVVCGMRETWFTHKNCLELFPLSDSVSLCLSLMPNGCTV